VLLDLPVEIFYYSEERIRKENAGRSGRQIAAAGADNVLASGGV
jgi:hypothetical protein